MQPRFIVSYSRDGSLRKRGLTPPLPNFDAAKTEAYLRAQHNRSVTILRECVTDGPNKGQFFLDYIWK